MTQSGSNFLLTSESVSDGHPDKICDQVSDAVLDAALAGDPTSRVACETSCTTNRLWMYGEITTAAQIDFEAVARGVIRDIDTLISSSFGLALRGGDVFTTSDVLDLSLSQPLRIESGSARIDLPAGRTAYGEALRERIDASLEPSGRELDLRAS